MLKKDFALALVTLSSHPASFLLSPFKESSSHYIMSSSLSLRARGSVQVRGVYASAAALALARSLGRGLGAVTPVARREAGWSQDTSFFPGMAPADRVGEAVILDRARRRRSPVLGGGGGGRQRSIFSSLSPPSLPPHPSFTISFSLLLLPLPPSFRPVVPGLHPSCCSLRVVAGVGWSIISISAVQL